MQPIKHTILVIYLSLCSFAFSGELPVTAHLEYNSIFNAYYITVENNSTNFICIDGSLFDSTKGNIVISDPLTGRVKQKGFSDSNPTYENGVNLLSSFTFIKPKSKREFFVDIGNFEINKNSYNASYFVNYYKCSDISNESKWKKKVEIPVYSFEKNEQIDIPEDFLKTTAAKSMPNHEATH